ncbi:MAG TPA: response regulator transcription factor [Verrucomicrobiae bacterium]|nr:response regulator transcription factor [Verrucomicrobiae bacterium]
MPITVLLADDNVSIRKAILHLLQGDPDIQVLAEATDFAQTMELVRKLHPQVVIMDVHMNDERALTPERLKSGFSGSCLLAISIWIDDETRSFANSIGAAAFLDKTTLATQLIQTIRNCVDGQDRDQSPNNLGAAASG